MGTAGIQGELWGTKANDWAELGEPPSNPVYTEVFRRAGVGPGVALLDVGCGAGTALAMAAALGADVSGLDASPALVAIARRKLAGARIEIGEMEELPFTDASFDVVTGFNAFQFANDPVQALREARRVCKPEGRVAVQLWGNRADCEFLTATVAAIGALAPPPPPDAPKPPPMLSEPGIVEKAIADAGLEILETGDTEVRFDFPDVETAWRCYASAGLTVRMMGMLGADRVEKAAKESLVPFTRPDGSVLQKNRFRWLLTRRR